MERIPKSQIAIASASIGVVSIALVIFIRRVSVPSFGELGSGETVLYGAIFAVATSAVLKALAEIVACSRRLGGFAPIASLLVTLIFLAGLSTEPVTILSGVVAVWGTFALLAYGEHTASSTVIANERPRSQSAVSEEPAPRDDLSLEHEGVEQQLLRPQVELTRTVNDLGEQVAGSMQFETTPGETATTLHVPLWPPLSATPRVQCDLEGIEGRASTPFVKPHGFRIEIRLPEPIDEPLQGTVRFLAETTVAGREAA